MNTSSLVQKVWNFCHTLRDDGVWSVVEKGAPSPAVLEVLSSALSGNLAASGARRGLDSYCGVK